MKITIKEAIKLAPYDNAITKEVGNAILDGDKYIELNQYEYQLALNKYNEQKQEALKLSACTRLNNNGIKAEKDGRISHAIRLYETNIMNGYPAHHSYKRLMVIYHRNKDYVNEIRVIKRALEVFPNYPEYVERLSKVENKI